MLLAMRRVGWARNVLLLLVGGLAIVSAPAVGHDEGSPTTTVTLTPEGPYAASQQVTVTGNGFPPSSSARLAQCNLDRSSCVTHDANFQVNSEGGFSRTVTVTSSFTA